MGFLPLIVVRFERCDDLVDAAVGHADDGELLGDLDRADLAADEIGLVGDGADEVAGADAGRSAERDVDEAGGAALLAGGAAIAAALRLAAGAGGDRRRRGGAPCDG